MGYSVWENQISGNGGEHGNQGCDPGTGKGEAAGQLPVHKSSLALFVNTTDHHFRFHRCPAWILTGMMLLSSLFVAGAALVATAQAQSTTTVVVQASSSTPQAHSSTPQAGTTVTVTVLPSASAPQSQSSSASYVETAVPTGTPIPGDYTGALRPQIHFSPPQHFMNDPNGMFLDASGTYHLYYQCKDPQHLTSS